MQLDAFPMDLLKRRVEYEMERGIRPSFGRNFFEDIFSCKAHGKQRRKQSLALRIGIAFSPLLSTHTNPGPSQRIFALYSPNVKSHVPAGQSWDTFG